MKEKSSKKLISFASIIILSCIISTIGYVFINGIPLLNVPKAEDISYVEISDERLNIDTQKFTEIHDIENALNLTNFLLYKSGTREHEEALIELVFHLKDESSFIIGVNEKTMHVNGKGYIFKGNNGETFIKVLEGMFFMPALVELEENK